MDEKPFADLVKHLKNLMDQLSSAYMSFAIYDAMMEEKAPNLLGKEKADENVKTINKFNHFFGPIEWAVFVHAMLTLAKFFDKGDRPLSIFTIIEFIKAHRDKLTAADFKEHFKDRIGVEELSNAYKDVTDDQLIEIEDEIQKNKPLIEKLKTLRDQYFAHNDINKKEVKINSGEILELFKIVEEIMQKICGAAMEETWGFDPLRETCKEDTSTVIDHLQRFEPYRLKEIEEWHQKQVSEIKKNFPEEVEIKHSTMGEIMESEQNLLFVAPSKYGRYYENASQANALLQDFIKSVNHDRFIFAAFLSQVRKHHTLAFFSVMRLHHVQAMMDLRQVLEAGACAAYAIANTKIEDFADLDDQGQLDPSQDLTKKRNAWLDENFKAGSIGLKNMKGSINRSSAHSNIVYAHRNFKFDALNGKFETPFFDYEDDLYVKTDLWTVANITIGLTDLIYGVAQKYGGVVFSVDFLPRLKALEEENKKLKEVLMQNSRLIKHSNEADSGNNL